MKQQALLLIAGLVVVALVLIYFYGMGSGRRYEGFDTGKNKFTMYYVDWCPHCQHAKPDFEALRDASPVDVNGQLVEVDMVNPEKNPELTKGKPIKGYPTILLTKSTGDIVEYEGSRDKEGYMSFLKNNL
jgi:thiol-disulfide isomerase/thioredoxin